MLVHFLTILNLYIVIEMRKSWAVNPWHAKWILRCPRRPTTMVSRSPRTKATSGSSTQRPTLAMSSPTPRTCPNAGRLMKDRHLPVVTKQSATLWRRLRERLTIHWRTTSLVALASSPRRGLRTFARMLQSKRRTRLQANELRNFRTSLQFDQVNRITTRAFVFNSKFRTF